MDYLPTGMMQSYNYRPDDLFWGQLSGALECIDAGTTFAVDQVHAIYSPDHATATLEATRCSGLRSIYAYAVATRFRDWDKSSITPEFDFIPEWAMQQIEEFAAKYQHPDGLIHIGLGFDFFFLPKEVVVDTFKRLRAAGIKLITSHMAKNIVLGTHSVVDLLNGYGLLGPDILISHGNQLTIDEYKKLKDRGVHIASTPDSECQMGFGWPAALHPDVNGTLGVDSAAITTGSLVYQARALLQMAPQQTNQPLLDRDAFPQNLRGSTTQVFNMMTIGAAKAVGLQNKIGSIAEGKLADLVIFDATSISMMPAVNFDPVAAILRHSNVRDVNTVIIDGKIRKRNGELLHGSCISWDDIVAKLNSSYEAIQRRMDATNLEVAGKAIMELWHVDSTKFEKVK